MERSGIRAPDRPLFTGSSEHALDEKGRLVVPARFRERLGPGFFLTIAPPDACLALFPAPAWHEICDRLQAAPNKDARFRAFVRHLFAHTEELSPDAQGRITLPAPLRALAGIEKETMLIGSLTRVEVWAKDRYQKQAREVENLPDFATELGLF